MKNLPLEWDVVREFLDQVPGLKPERAKTPADVDKFYRDNFDKYLKEGEGKKGLHFFLIEFSAGEVVMPKGVYSDYTGYVLSGSLRVRDTALAPARLTVPSCWKRRSRWRRGFDNWVLDRTDRRTTAGSDGPARRHGWFGTVLARGLRRFVSNATNQDPGEIALSRPQTLVTADRGDADADLAVLTAVGTPFVKRIMGVSSVLWNLPRSVTLVAGRSNVDPDPCRLLLFKRYVLNDLIKKAPAFYRENMKVMVETTLPRLLADNHLFRTTLFVDDVRPGQWPDLVARLRQSTAGEPSAAAELRTFLDDSFRAFLAGLDVSLLGHDGPPEADLARKEKYQLVKRINKVLKDKRLSQGTFVSRQRHSAVSEQGKPSVQEFSGIRQTGAATTEATIVAHSRQLLDAALAGCLFAPRAEFHPTARAYAPLSEETVAAFIADLTKALSEGEPLLPNNYEEGDTVFSTGEPADALYFILNGRFRVGRQLPAGEVLINNLEAGGSFGELCLIPNMVRRATVTALTRGVLLKVPAELIRTLADKHPAIFQKLRLEQQRMRDRDRFLESQERLPPKEPPQRIAGKLLRATNLLLIDMDLCTRCDQCVRSCGEAHDDVPRFHRANPELRFGKWEVAGACVHCIDAPCQAVCPVGAITLLDNRAVQIHRDRCIGCTQCAKACPYHAIDLYAPLGPEEAPSLSRPKYPNVATKCDLCLTDDHDPPCVSGCPYGAAQRGRPEELFPDLKGWAAFHEAHR